MVFFTAGMGGGTGTGAAPILAKAASEAGLLTVGVVTRPFHFEGLHRSRLAEGGLQALASSVDTLIVIPNQNLFWRATERTSLADAFRMADEVLYDGVRSVTDLMVIPGLINLDFADVRAVMKGGNKAMMGTGECEVPYWLRKEEEKNNVPFIGGLDYYEHRLCLVYFRAVYFCSF